MKDKIEVPRWYPIAILVLFILIFLVFCTNLGSATDYPAIQPYVNDFGNVLTPTEENSLNTILTDIEENTTVEMVVLTVENTNGEDRILYSAHVGDKNGVGKQEESNGVIISWSKDNEKGLAIATGRGIESQLNDAKLGRILRDNRPLFDAGNYSEGFQLIIANLSKEIGYQNQTPTDDSEINIWILLVFIIIVIVIIAALGAGSSGSGGSGVGSGYYGGGSSSGGSFGGGGFGGGGASG